MKNLFWIGGLCLILLVSGCDAVQNQAQPLKLSDAQQKVAQKSNHFGFDLLNHTLKEETQNPNVVVSPLSVSMAFGLALNGAKGNTRTEIENTLAIAGLSPEAINQTYRTLLDQLPKLDPKVQLNIANAIWYDQQFGTAVKPDFLATNQTYFDAKVQALNFKDPAAVNTINNWVNTSTKGKISKILDSISANEVMFLMNALYFKGTWTTEFDEKETSNAPFTVSPGKNTNVPMMKQTGQMAYAENDLFQAVELPYGDEIYTMTILLPKEGGSSEKIIADLSSKWDSWQSTFRKQKIALQLPRWKTAYEVTLNGILQTLGIKEAFMGGIADFTGIADARLSISKVKHKTFIEVNEKGTEAAAVTSIGIEVTSFPNMPQMVVNRPFLFVIREKSSGTILFLGQIQDPTR
ncbi:MAG: serpin family protein [Bacteroidetes Order II. Incertae sedis bacterium]|nr:serpin family protein [Bacteroidetes Order II. bacterium]